MNLSDIIPESNTFNAYGLSESIYDRGFVGAFTSDGPAWARRAAQILDWEFDYNTPGTKKRLSDISLPNPQGDSFPNHVYALNLWEAAGKPGPEPPFNIGQNYGICVDSSGVEGEDCIFGWRAVHMNEEWKYISAHHKYANRGYRSDGWSGAGWASVAMKVGAAFRIKYDWADYTDEDHNEYLVAREWPPRGLPAEFAAHTQRLHPYQDGACTRFEGGVEEMKKVIANGGFLHTSGVRTGAGTPFRWGRTGAHMQTVCSIDWGEDIRRWASTYINLDDDDAVCGVHQTWDEWSGQCPKDKFPEHWKPQPQGMWIVSAKQILSNLSIDFAIMPWVIGFPRTTPPTPEPYPSVSGTIYSDVKAPIRGLIRLDATGHQYYFHPNGDGSYTPKPYVSP